MKNKLNLIGIIIWFTHDAHKPFPHFCRQRFSNNSYPKFTDDEVLIAYLFCGYNPRYFGIKEIIHTFIKVIVFS